MKGQRKIMTKQNEIIEGNYRVSKIMKKQRELMI